jgi:hypothetical protein
MEDLAHQYFDNEHTWGILHSNILTMIVSGGFGIPIF